MDNYGLLQPENWETLNVFYWITEFYLKSGNYEILLCLFFQNKIKLRDMDTSRTGNNTTNSNKIPKY